MISIGPLALALERLIAVLGIIIFMIAASWISRRHGKDSDKAAWYALLIGLAFARVGYVVQNWSSYALDPLNILYIWQGGFSPLIGLAAAAIALVLFLRKSSALLPMGLALTGSAAAALIASSLFIISAEQPLPQGLEFQSLSGEVSALDDRKGKPFVINLWATWCPPCRREMPMMVEEAARSPVPIILANQGEDVAKVKEWLDSQRLTSADVLLDQNQSAIAAIGSAGLPATLFVDSKGIIRAQHVGEISRAALLAGIRDLE